MPDPYISRVRTIVLHLTSAHAANRKHEDVLVKCIAAALSLSRGAETARERDMIVALINQLSLPAAADLIREESYLLRGATGVGAALVRVLGDPNSDEYVAGICLSELRHVAAAEIAAEAANRAANLRQAAVTWAHEDEITDDCRQGHRLQPSFFGPCASSRRRGS